MSPSLSPKPIEGGPQRSELTPGMRRSRAQAAAFTSWANTADRTARTAPATAASMARFEVLVDPLGELTPEERARRAESARKAHMARLAFLSAKARRARKSDPKSAA